MSRHKQVPSAPTHGQCPRGTPAARRISVAAFLIAMIAVLPAAFGEAAAGVRDDRPNLIGGELGGRGLVLTLNYERFFTNHLGVGAGIMAIGASGGTIAIMPVYVSFVPGDVHSLYLGAGVAFLGGGGSVQDFESTSLLQLSVGYQYQGAGGFFVRPLFTYMTSTDPGGGNDGYLIWPGLTIGGSF